MNIRLRRFIQTAGTALFLSASLTFPAFSASPAGSLEAAGHTAISGWAYDPENPGSRITVELLLSGDGGPGDSVILEAEASESRPELTETAGSSDCGFSVSVDWESLAGDSYTITAEAVVDGSRFPLEGTLTYTKSEGGASSPEAEEDDSQPVRRQGEFLGTFTASGYCNCPRCSGGHNRTYSGTVPKARHTIAADLSVFPLGTEIMIDGITYTVEDMGSGVHSDRLDIYFDSHQEALDFGLKEVDVYEALKEE